MQRYSLLSLLILLLITHNQSSALETSYTYVLREQNPEKNHCLFSIGITTQQGIHTLKEYSDAQLNTLHSQLPDKVLLNKFKNFNGGTLTVYCAKLPHLVALIQHAFFHEGLTSLKISAAQSASISTKKVIQELFIILQKKYFMIITQEDLARLQPNKIAIQDLSEKSHHLLGTDLLNIINDKEE